jgi:ATP-dependent DNA helicase PIF1
MLNEMRFGKLSPSSIAKFRALARPISYDDGLEPTVLFPRREDVDRANTAKLLALNGDGWTYMALDSGSVEPVQRAKLLSNFMATSSLELRVNAQVMLIKNMDETLVNGSMGKVIGFEHKSLFETDSAGRWIRDVESTLGDDDDDQAKLQYRADQRAKFRSGHSSDMRPNPVVRFNTPLGKRDMVIEPDTFKTELPNGEVQASRLQVGLLSVRFGECVRLIRSSSR